MSNITIQSQELNDTAISELQKQKLVKFVSALQSYDVDITLDNLEEFVSSDGQVKDLALKTQEHDSDKAELIRNLFESLAKQLSVIKQKNQVATELYKQHIAFFNSYLLLWKSMLVANIVGREFTADELEFYVKSISQQKELLDELIKKSDEDSVRQAQAIWDKYTLETYGLLFDEDTLADINQIISNILNSHPTLVVGDKGIAKTQIVKFVMSLYTDEPLILSIKGDMMSDEFIGKIEHDAKNKTFVFVDGVLLKAMREGKPLLLDEINFGDQAIIARLQDLLLREPGEKVFIQEKGEFVTIAHGFAVFATANEASVRYKHREILDPALRDRFDIVFRHYPDAHNTSFLETSDTLMRMAYAAACDYDGLPSEYIDLDQLEKFTRLAFATQYLYSNPAKDVIAVFEENDMKTQTQNDAESLMSDCITPRALYRVVSDASEGNLPGKRLDDNLITKILHNLDQAGSHKNFEIAQQIQVLLG
ncbi:MAG: AAA family ATPase [Coriobacteriia bacterium]|nr:AAA family ATPase [Coriobacteriia bacterium]